MFEDIHFSEYEMALILAVAQEISDGGSTASVRRKCSRLLADYLPSLQDDVRRELANELAKNAQANAAAVGLGDTVSDTGIAAAAEATASGLREYATTMSEDAVMRYVTAQQWARAYSARYGAEEAVRMATMDLAGRGLTCYTYIQHTADGVREVRVPADVGMRRYVEDGFHRRAEEQSKQIAAETTGLVEVSITAGARPSHREWQGKVYSVGRSGGRYESFEDACRVGDPVDGFGGYNCRHRLRVYNPAVGKMYEDPLEGTGYTHDEVSELRTRQRTLERRVRAYERRQAVAVDRGWDDEAERAREAISANKARISELVSGNRQVLRRERWREQV